MKIKTNIHKNHSSQFLKQLINLKKEDTFQILSVYSSLSKVKQKSLLIGISSLIRRVNVYEKKIKGYIKRMNT